jgi:hypothetical protein
VKTILLFFAFILPATVNYQVEIVKKFPQATCVKLHKTESHAKDPDEFFIAAKPGMNPKWLSREHPSCAVAWQEAWKRNIQ